MTPDPVTLPGCDNADLLVQVELHQQEPDCSTATLRVQPWQERHDGTVPADIYANDDWLSLDRAGLAALRDLTDQAIARIDAHTAAVQAADDADGW
ncbi:hypothetical protein [Dactylosporangium sp. CA-092794]|uniref:hypothetical protein n=1 Tax=Dactylosporangium sp. CA-092794 TaxID=3239929 RepID=UPI003D8ED2E0